MRVCIRKSDNRIIEAQSGDTGDLAVLIRNAVAAGYNAADVQTSVMADSAFQTALAAQGAADRVADPIVIRDKTFSDDVDRQDLLTRLQTATPAQIKTYVANNVTDLASAKLLIAKILLVLGTLAKS